MRCHSLAGRSIGWLSVLSALWLGACGSDAGGNHDSGGFAGLSSGLGGRASVNGGASSTTGGTAGGAASIAGSDQSNSGGVSSGGAANVAGASSDSEGGVPSSAGAASATAGTAADAGGAAATASGLTNPIHVVAGATLDVADGTLTHPFPTLADAVTAIHATEALASPWTGRIVVHQGRYEVRATVELPPSADIEFQAGATMAMAADVNLHANRSVKVLGTEPLPVVFTWLTDGKHWGSFTLFVPESQANEFTWATFEHGGEVTYQGIAVRGALALEGSGGHISHCTFQNNAGDDGLSLGNSPAVVDHCSFLNNSGDGIDVDGPGGEEIAFCYFDANGNDGLDIGEGSDLWAHDNVMINSVDTGVEVGEASHPTIDHNIMVGNAMGIGIKDDADPIVSNNTVYGNQFGITGYHFKADYGTGKGRVNNTIVWGSTIADVALVDGASTQFSYSCIQSGKYTDSTNKNGSGSVAALAGVGVISAGAGCDDPLFVDAAARDFHLKSTAGHFDAGSHAWLNDTATSPCIDSGAPQTAVGDEPAPNGGRVDMGVYGGTAEASHSP